MFSLPEICGRCGAGRKSFERSGRIGREKRRWNLRPGAKWIRWKNREWMDGDISRKSSPKTEGKGNPLSLSLVGHFPFPFPISRIFPFLSTFVCIFREFLFPFLFLNVLIASADQNDRGGGEGGTEMTTGVQNPHSSDKGVPTHPEIEKRGGPTMTVREMSVSVFFFIFKRDNGVRKKGWDM